MLELENLDDVSFSELMGRSISEIPQLCPEWTDFNAHDPGITFLEMLMWLAEMQRYYLSQITESHLESYLRLLGTSARDAEPAVILVKFFPEKTAFVKRDTVFYIGDIPFRSTNDMTIVSNKPEIIPCEDGSFIVRRNLSSFKGKILPLYFSLDDETNVNPMGEGFYPRAEIRTILIAQSEEIICSVNDGTYGFYQSGFINIRLPEEFEENTAQLRLKLVSDDNFELPSVSCFSFDIRELVQLDKDGNTLGANGRVKENVLFSADIEGVKINAEVYKEIGSGRNPETPQDAFERFKSEQRHIPRAVTKNDYARIALETPGVRAELVNVFSKEPGKISVCVKTVDGRLRENEIKNLRKALFAAKPIGIETEILTPIVFSAKLVISVKTDGWAGGKRLAEHISKVFAPLEKSIGAFIDMPEIFRQIDSSAIVSEIKGINLCLGKGVELAENDTLKLPDDGLLSLDEIIIQ